MTVRRILIATGSAIALAAMAGSALAAGTVAATANASATVVSPYTLVKTSDMQFGTVVRPSNANSNAVTLDANDTVTVTGTGNGSTVSSTTSTARFTLTGTPTTYSTSQGVVITQTGLGPVSATLPVATTGTYGTIPAAGFQELRVGGAFSINSATPSQAYTGTLTLTVNYN